MSPEKRIPPSADHRHTVLSLPPWRKLRTGRDLGHAGAGHHPRGADRAGPDAHLERHRRRDLMRSRAASSVATLPTISGVLDGKRLP